MMESEHKLWLVGEASKNYGEIPYMVKKLRTTVRLLEQFFPDIGWLIYEADNGYDMIRPTELLCLNLWLAQCGVDVLDDDGIET